MPTTVDSGEADQPFPVAIPSAGVLFFDDTDRVLLVRTTYKATWEIPGGVIEIGDGETPLLAARREVAEELGIDVTVGPLLAVDSVPSTGERPALLAFIFDGGVLGASQLSRIRFVDKEIVETRFCGPAEIVELLLPRLARRVLSSVAARGGDLAYLRHGE